MFTRQAPPTRRTALTPHRVARTLVSAAMHLLAITITFACFVALFATQRVAEVFPLAFAEPQLQPDLIAPLVIILGLAACAWGLVFITYLLAQSRIHVVRTTSMRPSTGTIITETLIVLPVFFLLTFGLAQMGTSSIAGLLTTLGTYEAGRTLSVWGPEIGNDRAPGGATSQSTANEKARLAAAAVIAPATPELASGLQGCNQGNSLPKMRSGMVAAGLSPEAVPPLSIRNMPQAFGVSAFALRGPTKLTLAYCATEVSWTSINSNPGDTERNEFTTTVRYHHPAVFPLVGILFAADPGAGPWITPHVSTITRTYTMWSQLTPNPER